ncbi:MAG: Gfo/Idh/MocA family protein [Candidatus Brocadiia bacterium]
MGTVRLGILGFAHGHVDMYCERWRQQPLLGAQVVAGWDHDAGRAAKGCERHQIAPAATAEELLSRADVDAVVIGAETSLHAELVEKAAAAGKAIVLQKPLSLTLADADRIIAAVDRSKVPFTLAWQMRVDPHNVKVKRLLAEGRFGKVYMARRRHCLNTQRWKDFDHTWHVQPEFNRDIFADDAAHAMDFIYWLMGMPRTVMAEMGTLLNPRIPNDNAIAVFRYADGRFAEVSCTFVEVAGENTLEVVCQNGTIIGNYGDLVSVAPPRPAGGIQLKWRMDDDAGWTVSDIPDINGQGERIAGLAGPLAEFLSGRRPPIATAAEGRDVLRMVLACYESAASGTRVTITPE